MTNYRGGVYNKIIMENIVYVYYAVMAILAIIAAISTCIGAIKSKEKNSLKRFGEVLAQLLQVMPEVEELKNFSGEEKKALAYNLTKEALPWADASTISEVVEQLIRFSKGVNSK